MNEDGSIPAADLPDHSIGGVPVSPPAGLYIHVPFCRAKCPYCDFYSVTRLDLIDTYIQALLAELKHYRHHIALADTIYFGGGTPSVLTPRQLAQVLDGLRACFTVAADAEVTLEVNPGTVNRDNLADFRQAGVNRLNIGLQSTDDRHLTLLGRIHSAKTGIDTYHRARAVGFDNVGLDLIYAIPGQTLIRWEAEMAGVVRLAPDHLSCYTLTIEPGTPMARLVRENRFQPPGEQAVGDLFSATADFLNGNGYRQYEISNFARHAVAGAPDRRSRHNRKYWNISPYLGFGPFAHSYMDGCRWWNHGTLDGYLSALKEGKRPVAGREALTRAQQVIEFVYLGLRQTDGIDTADFASRFNTDISSYFVSQLPPLGAEGLIETSLGRVRLTRRGMRFMESVVDRLLGDAG